jgi:hypothetical protein
MAQRSRCRLDVQRGECIVNAAPFERQAESRNGQRRRAIPSERPTAASIPSDCTAIGAGCDFPIAAARMIR